MGIDWAVLEQEAMENTLASHKYEVHLWVDNVRGASGGPGTYKAPFAQVSQAITAWVAILATLPNIYRRACIHVIGTGTAYTALTTLPAYLGADIVGEGAPACGNGTGIAIIGVNGADGITGTAVRSMGLFNLQIRSGGAFWCMDIGNLLRSVIEDCHFMANSVAPDGGIRLTDASGGVRMRHNTWGGDNLQHPKVGIQLSGANFDNSLVEDNVIIGTTAGVLVDAACVKGDLTVFRRNHIGDGGHGCVTAIDDNATTGTIMYDDNCVMGTNLICCVNNGAARVHGNKSANGFVAVTAS
jgi:hypothetical protein